MLNKRLLGEKRMLSNNPEGETHSHLAEILQASYDTVNAEMKQILGFTKMLREQQAYKIACFSCASPDCCTLSVETYLPEAIVLLHKLSNADRDEDIRRLVLQGRRQRDFLGSPADDIARYYDRLDLWCDKQEQCVLLDEHGRCSVYDYAPSACRLYFVLEGSMCAKGKVNSANTAWFEQMFMPILDNFYKTFDVPSYFTHVVTLPGAATSISIPGGYPIGVAVEMAARWLFPQVDLLDVSGEEDDV